MDNTERYNVYAENLENLEKEYKQKVEDLITSVKNCDLLYWRSFSRNLDDIKEQYKGYLLGLILQYNLEFKVNRYENIYPEKVKSFSTLCNDTFDEIYNYYEKLNRLQ